MMSIACVATVEMSRVGGVTHNGALLRAGLSQAASIALSDGANYARCATAYNIEACNMTDKYHLISSYT